VSRVFPILFNTDMVRAILDGRKTVTRRLVKPQPPNDVQCPLGYCVDGDKKDIGKYAFGSHEAGGKMVFCKPPCEIGDILYVRESVFQGVGHYLDVSGETVSVLTHKFEYYADGLHEKDHWKDKYERIWMHRRPSIHMPKEVARIFLRVKDVRMERLQEMRSEDALKEGIKVSEFDLPNSGVVTRFKHLWNSTIKKSDRSTYGWDANPWVWVIEFERCDKPED